MLKEFKEFAMKGNVLDLAVAVVIGGAFGQIVSALVDSIIMPLVGILLGGINLAEESIAIGEAMIQYGAFIQSIIDFFIISFSIFLFIKLLNQFKRKKEEQPKAEEPKGPTPEELLAEIRDLLKEGK